MMQNESVSYDARRDNMTHQHTISVSNTKPTYNNDRKSAGRPIGSTKISKSKHKQSIKDCKYKIICRYIREISLPIFENTSKKNIFFRILAEETRKFRLGDKFKFPYHTAISRIHRWSLNADGSQSPLLLIENKIIDLILCMSKIKRALTVSECLRLINN